MISPKHLWSDGSKRVPWRIGAIVTVVLMLVIAGVVYPLTSGGGSKHQLRASTKPHTSTPPTATAAIPPTDPGVA